MYINITDSETGNNKGSSSALVSYLEKENRIKAEEGIAPELWFGDLRRDILPQEVRVNTDNNIAKLGKNDAKFYLINISPSQNEIAFLKEKYGEQGAAEKLKEYATRVMDTYAHNFKRNGIESNKDLLWYGKVEYNRNYTYTDLEVKEGLHREGEPKEGEQMHVQIIVSRKDITNKIKLSPLNNSRGKNQQHSAKLGQFDRNAFKLSGEVLFDQMFDFDRSLKETIAYSLTMKNGSAEQKSQLCALENMETNQSNGDKGDYLDIARNIFLNTNHSLENLFETGGHLVGGFFEMVPFLNLENDQSQEDLLQQPYNKKRKKKKRPRQE